MPGDGILPEQEYVVVGAGPTGSLAAYSLAGRGHRVAIFHWRPLREKSCGGGVPASGMRSFGHLLEGVPRNEVRRIRLVAPSGNRVEIELDTSIAVFSRRDLDLALLKRAEDQGAVRLDARVLGVEPRADGYLIQAQGEGGRIQSHARFVVCADGAAGIVRAKLLSQDRTVTRAVPSREFSRSWNTYPAAPTADLLEIAYLEGGADGYAWSFPRIGHSSVGICEQDLGGGTRALRVCLERMIESERLTGTVRLSGIGSPIPSVRSSVSTHPVEGRRFVLVGDAAGAVDPITREGIHLAMSTGNAVGEVDPLERPGRYQAWFEQVVEPELQAAARWSHRFYSPRFLEWMVEGLRLSAPLRQVFRQILSGETSYRSLNWRLSLAAPEVLWQALKKNL